MSLEHLPAELLTAILAHYTPIDIAAKDYLGLRLVNRQFNEILVYALFDAEIGDRYFLPAFKRFAHDEAYVFRYWRAYLRISHPLAQPREILTGEQHRGSLRQALNEGHKLKVKATLQSAIKEIAPSLEDTASCSVGLISPTHEVYPKQLPEFEQCIYILCRIAIYLHGPWDAWNLLTSNVEDDYFQSFPRSGSSYTPSHDVLAWNIYAAAYLHNMDRVKILLEPLQVKTADQVALTQYTALKYSEFASPKPRRLDGRWHDASPPATLDEQRWVRVVGSTLIIAASLGHVELVSYLLHLEPNLRCKAFRTHLYRTSRFDAMQAAIRNDQRGVFQILVDWKWPLAIDAGFARGEYLSALETAVKKLRLEDSNDNILAGLLRMSNVWHAPYFLERMLQSAAQTNDHRLGKVVLDHLGDKSSRLFDYYCPVSYPPLWNQIIRPREFAMGTASYVGHGQFVQFLLQHKGSSRETGLEAIECAIHSLTCHVRTTNESHITILKSLLQNAGGLFLEAALVKAACKRNKQFVAAFAANINLEQKAYCNWNIHLHRRCHSTAQMNTASVMDPDEKASLGEVALAAALSSRQFETACMLIEEFGVVLERYWVRTTFSTRHEFKMDLAALTKHLIERGMTVKQSNEIGTGLDTTCTEVSVTFLPQVCSGIEPVEFRTGPALYCML